MAEEAKTGEESAKQVDPNQDPNNIKSEMNRKFDNSNKSIEDLKNQGSDLNTKLDAILNQMEQESTKKTQVKSEVDLEDLKYSDPDKYAEIKVQQAEDRILKKVDSRTVEIDKKNLVIASLASDYPELNDAGSALYKKAIEVGGKYDKAFAMSSQGVEIIVSQAARELGVIPLKFRTKPGEEEENRGENMDEFIGGSSSGSSETERPKKDKELHPFTRKTAELMGLDLNDKKVVDNLKGHSQRTNWNRWA